MGGRASPPREESRMRIEVVARMVIEIPDEEIADDGTIVGSENWTNGPTKVEDHAASATVFYSASTIAKPVSRSPIRAKVTSKKKQAEQTRYRDYQDRLDLVICGDCSTRSTLAVIDRDEMVEHDAWHAEQVSS
jgi:hypothetical protein